LFFFDNRQPVVLHELELVQIARSEFINQ
jgi:hypothetical protein